MDSQHPFSVTSWIANTISGGTVIVSLLGLLPTILTVVASAVALIWYAIQISESETVKRWTALRKQRKIARLQAQLLSLVSHSHDEAVPPKT